MSTQALTVTGTTCGHCVASVSEDVSEVPAFGSVLVVSSSLRLRRWTQPTRGRWRH